MFTILVTFLTVIADQITKYFVCINMDLGETIPVIKNVVHLTYIINPGAAFGLFPHQDVLFLGIVMILLLAFAWLRNRIPQKPVYFPLPLLYPAGISPLLSSLIQSLIQFSLPGLSGSCSISVTTI